MTLSDSIRTLRSEKFTDDEILEDIQKIRPDLSESIGTLLKEGFKSNEIIDDIGSLQLGNAPKKKLDVLESIGAGAATVIGSVGALGEGLANLPWFGDSVPEEEKTNKSLDFLGSIPESESELGRRARVGTSALLGGAAFGPAAALGGLVGSQAGQSVRETFGNEGKFDEFGAGEALAIGVDIISSLGTSLFAEVMSQAPRIATAQVARGTNVPQVFQTPGNRLQQASMRAVLKGDETALQDSINSFGQQQIRTFEQEASNLSPNRFTELQHADASGIRRHTDQVMRNAQLNTISPLNLTSEEGGLAIQGAANQSFNDTVIAGERQAYRQARASATGLSGTAPATVSEARALRDQLTRNTPTPEQQPVINFLNGLIDDLESTIPGSTRPASNLLDANGNPLIPAQNIAPQRVYTPKPANDLVDLVQRANQAVNYGSELRLQSHRLIPIIRTLRNETQQVLSNRPAAQQLFQAANDLHAENAQVWGTRYMRNLRFAENPEKLIGQTKLSSNLRNLREGIENPQIQSLAERLIIDDLTQKGSDASNRLVLNNLRNNLSPEANNAANALINAKDPLTTQGGRAAVRNSILKDASQSISSGKRPEMILDLMQTPKGYGIVREALSYTPQSREVLRSMERLFIEDIFNAATDANGMLNFQKARTLLKNNDVRNVVREIGGDRLLNQFTSLETFANNLNRNKELYSNPVVQGMFRSFAKAGKNALYLGPLLHMLHVPLPILVTLGLARGVTIAGKAGYSLVRDAVLTNPRAMRLLEQVTLANTSEKLSELLPKLVVEIEKHQESNDIPKGVSP